MDCQLTIGWRQAACNAIIRSNGEDVETGSFGLQFVGLHICTVRTGTLTYLLIFGGQTYTV